MVYVVYVFDVYGILFDVYVVVCKYVEKFGLDVQCLLLIWCEKQLEYFWVCVLMGQYKDFWELIQQVFDIVFVFVFMVDKLFWDDFISVYLEFDCYLEVFKVLIDLKVIGVKIVILLNGLLFMLDVVVKVFGLIDIFDDIFFVDDFWIFKIDLQFYEMVMIVYWIYLEEVLF